MQLFLDFFLCLFDYYRVSSVRKLMPPRAVYPLKNR